MSSSPRLFGDGLASRVGAFLAGDAVWRWFLGALGLLVLPFMVPGLSLFDLGIYANSYLDFFLLLVVLLALRRDLHRLPSASERRFWDVVTAAVTCWWLVRFLYVLIPTEQRGTAAHLTADGLYLLFYLGLLLAVESKPHRSSQAAAGSRMTMLERLGLTVLVFVLLVYFVLIPSRVSPDAYRTWESSLLLYLALDAILVLRFGQLAKLSGSRRWRTLYGLFCVTAILWGTLGVLEILWRRGAAPWLDATWTNVLWVIPTVLLTLTIRLRHYEFGDSEVSRIEKRHTRRGPVFGGESFLVIATLILPLLHLGFSRLGLTDSAARGPQEWLVLLSLIFFGGLMLAERFLLQEQSLHQNTQLASLIESAPLPIVLLDAEHKVLTCNPAFESLFLYSRAQIRGENIDWKINIGESRSEAEEITRRVMAGETTFSVSQRYRSDGQPVDVRIFGVPLLSGGSLIGVFAIYQDLTERLRAERTLKESEERFRLLSEAAFEGILLTVDGIIVDCNQQAADLFGFSIDKMIGVPMGTRVDRSQQALVAERSRAGYDLPYELDCYHRDRSKFRIAVRGKAVPYKGGKARVTVVRDVTETRKLEEQLRQSQKMEAIGRLSAGIAHDFNNLLTVILGHGSMLVKKLEAGTSPREWAEELNQAARRAAKVTQKLLAFGRRQPLQFKVLDLNKVVEGIEDMLGRLIDASITLKLELTPDVGWVKADPGQLEQVLLNLVINARDAMPDGGELTLATSEQKIGESADRAGVELEPGLYVCLEVSDTGEGMGPETQARVFEPFFSTKEKEAGTGLGLSTVHGIVRQSGGSITVDSVLGEGTTFRIYLPKIL